MADENAGEQSRAPAIGGVRESVARDLAAHLMFTLGALLDAVQG